MLLNLDNDAYRMNKLNNIKSEPGNYNPIVTNKDDMMVDHYCGGLPRLVSAESQPPVKNNSNGSSAGMASLHSSSLGGGDAAANDSNTKNTFMFSKFAFPFKLHRLLEDAEKNGHASIISWTPSGRAFKIHKPKEFAALVMPRYFDQTKYRSFQRQLYIYGFDRVKKDKSLPPAEVGAYTHELFVRGQAELCLNMSRKKVKGTGRSRSPCKKPAPFDGNSSASTLSMFPSSSLAFSESANGASTNEFSAAEEPLPGNTASRRCSQRLAAAQAGGMTGAGLNLRRHQSAPTVATRKLAPKPTNRRQSVTATLVEGLKRCSLGFLRSGPSSGTRKSWEKEKRKSSVIIDGEEVFFWNEKFHFVTEDQAGKGDEF